MQLMALNSFFNLRKLKRSHGKSVRKWVMNNTGMVARQVLFTHVYLNKKVSGRIFVALINIWLSQSWLYRFCPPNNFSLVWLTFPPNPTTMNIALECSTVMGWGIPELENFPFDRFFPSCSMLENFWNRVTMFLLTMKMDAKSSWRQYQNASKECNLDVHKKETFEYFPNFFPSHKLHCLSSIVYFFVDRENAWNRCIRTDDWCWFLKTVSVLICSIFTYIL